jgi:gamma-glutamyltranspeptidase
MDDLAVHRLSGVQGPAPRFNSEHMHLSFKDHRDALGVLTIEDRIPSWTLAELVGRGHQLKTIGPFDMKTGVVAVLRDPLNQTLVGAADPRRERVVWGW